MLEKLVLFMRPANVSDKVSRNDELIMCFIIQWKQNEQFSKFAGKKKGN